jgi:hypothetical protein
MWFSGESTPLPTRSQSGGSVESPLYPLHRLVCQTSLYHILRQVVPILVHGCTILMGGHSMNRSIDLGMMTNHRLPKSTGQRPELSESTEHSSKPITQIPILHTDKETKVIAYQVTTWIKRYYCATQT